MRCVFGFVSVMLLASVMAGCVDVAGMSMESGLPDDVVLQTAKARAMQKPPSPAEMPPGLGADLPATMPSEPVAKEQ